MDSRLFRWSLVLAAVACAGCQDLLSKVKADPKEEAIKKGNENATAALQAKMAIPGFSATTSRSRATTGSCWRAWPS